MNDSFDTGQKRDECHQPCVELHDESRSVRADGEGYMSKLNIKGIRRKHLMLAVADPGCPKQSRGKDSLGADL